MRKTIVTLALAAFAFTANAQVLKSNFLQGYKEGDKLEKGSYTDRSEAIKADTWSAAFSNKPTAEPNPTIGAPLSYDGYPEGGPSIAFGGYAEGEKGARISVYSMTDGKQYARGTYYLSCLLNLSKLGSNGMADILGITVSHVGTSNRANLYVAREGNDRMRFGVSLLKIKAESTEAFDLDKTHLVVMKLDFDNQKVSLFVDPALGGEEPAATCVAEGDAENVLKHALRAVTFRNRSRYVGNIGNFRWCQTWADITAAQ